MLFNSICNLLMAILQTGLTIKLLSKYLRTIITANLAQPRWNKRRPTEITSRKGSSNLNCASYFTAFKNEDKSQCSTPDSWQNSIAKQNCPISYRIPIAIDNMERWRSSEAVRMSRVHEGWLWQWYACGNNTGIKSVQQAKDEWMTQWDDESTQQDQIN